MRYSNIFDSSFWNDDPSVIILSGGIGNQLFQYCFARQVSLEIGSNVYLDFSLISLAHRSSNQLPSIRNLPLDSNLLLDSVSKTAKTRAYLSIKFSRRAHDLYWETIESWCKAQDIDFIKQGRVVFDSNVEMKKCSIYGGSFTSFAYWRESPKVFLDEVFRLLSQYSSRKNNAHHKAYDIVIHARRGDYATNLKTRHLHGVYGKEYYLHTLSSMDDVSRREITILSDDFQFARGLANEIDLNFNPRRVEVATESNPFLALHQYSKCQTFIGCNSTFSWWLANLGDTKSRYLPLIWFDQGDFAFDSSNYFPKATKLVNHPFEY